MTGANSQGKKRSGRHAPAKSHGEKRRQKGGKADDTVGNHDVQDAERRMEQVVRAQGRLTKKGGKMVMSGASEFQMAGGYELALGSMPR